MQKKVHYCWFGGKPKPKSVLKYIENWQSVLPGYQIVEWNESNFDINACTYTKEAYENKKFAFVSDYARLFALFHHGGMYLDTDVEVCQNPEHLFEDTDVIFGMEELNFVATSTIFAKPKSEFIKEFMQSYHKRNFVLDSGECDLTTNVEVLTKLLSGIGFVMENKQQQLIFANENIKIFEQEYFSPYDYINLIDNRTDKTATVHHFGNSWGDNSSKVKHLIKAMVVKLFGDQFIKNMRNKIK